MLALFALVACDPGVTKPAEPAWNKQACAHSLMLLSDKHTAAQVTLPSGQRQYFDDVGCLVTWLENERVEPQGAWVRSPNADGWIAATSARFSSGATTPMDFGFVPADSGISFAELKTQVHARNHLRGATQ